MIRQQTVVLGCGNPARGDDALGPELIQQIALLQIPGVETDVDYQLNIEDAATIAHYRRVLFVDASVKATAPFELQPLVAANEISFTSHQVSPESVLAICQDQFQHTPEAWLLAIRGYQFKLGEPLSSRAESNLLAAVEYLKDWLTNK